jgi:diguanylate cyclase (GGDEF)-like protein
LKHSLPILHVGDILGGGLPKNFRRMTKITPHRNSLRRPLVRRISATNSHHFAESLNEMLSSAILAQDKELSGIVREVDDLLRTIKAEDPETQAVSSALQKTILCAVRQSLLDKELQSLALTDDLTGLYNRRAFLALATQQVKSMRRRGQCLLLFFVDVDQFKLINDSFGHREGDFALVRTAEALEKAFRDSDIVARLGGDEFAVLAPEATCQDQEVILRRLQRKVRDLNTERPNYELSISVGVARFDPKRSTSVGELMEEADAAMYQEKRRKGLVVGFGSPSILDS